MDVFSALADPTRREILCLLGKGPLDASRIAEHFDVTKPAISKHLKQLHAGGLVTRTLDPQRRIYGLDLNGLYDVENWIHERREAWHARLDSLQEFLEAKHGHKRRKD